MLESADACGVGLAAVSGDVVESTKYILKKGYNGQSSRGEGAGKSAAERGIKLRTSLLPPCSWCQSW